MRLNFCIGKVIIKVNFFNFLVFMCLFFRFLYVEIINIKFVKSFYRLVYKICMYFNIYVYYCNGMLIFFYGFYVLEFYF